MGQPIAKRGDSVTAQDTHIIMVPGPGGPVPTPLPHPFRGILNVDLSPTVFVNGSPIATLGSVANNTPPHVPQGGTFQRPPSNRATIRTGSPTVFANGRAVARSGDTANTCNDPVDLPNGVVSATGTVFAG